MKWSLIKKTLLKTKSFWVGLVTVGAGIFFYVKGGDVSLGTQLVLIGLAIITGRDAIEKLINK